jgi:hypothetical protein
MRRSAVCNHRREDTTIIQRLLVGWGIVCCLVALNDWSAPGALPEATMGMGLGALLGPAMRQMLYTMARRPIADWQQQVGQALATRWVTTLWRRMERVTLIAVSVLLVVALAEQHWLLITAVAAPVMVWCRLYGREILSNDTTDLHRGYDAG